MLSELQPVGTKPITNDYETGNVCGNCSGSLFTAGTPKYIEAHLDNIIACPGAPWTFTQKTIVLTQGSGSCGWGWTDGTWSAQYLLTATHSNFQVGRTSFLWFFALVATPCLTGFTNQNVCGVGFALGAGGTADIYFGPTIGP